MNLFRKPCKNCIDRRTLLKGAAATVPAITLASQAGITLAADIYDRDDRRPVVLLAHD